MKHLFSPRALFVLVATVFVLYSCEDDPIFTTGPTVTSSTSADLTLAPGEEFTFAVSASKADSDLRSITVKEGSSNLATSRFSVNGSPAAANPILLLDADDLAGFTYEFTITAQSEAATSITYTVEVADEAGETSSVSTTVTTVGIAPSISGRDPLSFAVEEGSTVAVRVSGGAGSGQMVSLEVREDGSVVDPARLGWDGVSMADLTNPIPLTASQVDTFTEIALTIDLPLAVGTYVYDMTIADEFGLVSDTLTYTITTTPSGTPVSAEMGIIYNRSGMQNGGFDFETFATVPSSSADADIRDRGNISMTSQTWLQSIEAVNGATVRRLIAGQGGLAETFDFATVTFKEDLQDFYAQGSAYDNDALQVGDLLAVSTASGAVYIVSIANINVTDDDNDDSYEFDIKY